MGGREYIECTAIILIKNSCLHELASAFLVQCPSWHCRPPLLCQSPGEERHSGTVYTGEIVTAIGRIREAYGGRVWVIHGFPFFGGGLVDYSTVWELRDIELWLAEVDWCHLGSPHETLDYFIKNFLSTSTSNTSCNTHKMALKLPSSLHSSDNGSFVSPGWEDLPRSLPTLGEENKRSLLLVMLTELNNKFALQLDMCPNTDHTSQWANDNPNESCLARLIDQGVS